jgi:RNA polymerase sigma factor (sigma-70 family)
MPTSALGRLVRRLATTDEADGELVRRFVDTRSGDAFEELVRRHGPAVFGVCRRALGDHHLAEDAFQAAFVVLARKAHTIRPPGAVGGWLYGVARRAALEAAAVRRRKHREMLPGTLPERPAEASEPDDSAALVDAAIADLPEALRTAVILCEIEGVSRAEAAGRLGVAEGTLSSRLARARKKLAERLRRRGVALPTSLGASVTVPPGLVRAAVQSATGTTTGVVLQLSDGVSRAMLLSKLRLVPVAVAGVVVALGGLGLWGAAATTAAPVPKAAERRDGVLLISSFADDEPLEAVKSDGTSVKMARPEGRSKLMNPRLSPDGKRAVCLDMAVIKNNPDVTVWNRFSIRLFGLGARAAEPKTIVEGVYNPSAVWSADGGAVYVSHIDPDRLADSEKEGEMVWFQTWAYTVADGTRERLKLPPEHKVVDVSPDGGALLTTTTTAVTHNQVLHLIPSGTLKPGKDGALASGLVYSARFSPDGKRLLMSGSFEEADRRAAGAWGVFVLDLGTRKPTRLDLPREVLENQAHRLCWSPDGRRIALEWEETIPRPAGVPAPPGPGEGRWTASRVTVCDADGGNAKVVVRREYGEPITGLDWR